MGKPDTNCLIIFEVKVFAIWGVGRLESFGLDHLTDILPFLMGLWADSGYPPSDTGPFQAWSGCGFDGVATQFGGLRE